MKATKAILAITLLFASAISYGQNQEKDSIIGKEDYYKERAKEDAQFEQEFNSKSKSEDKSFWKDQRAYEKELKKKDKIAHKAYMQGKKDAYAEHNNHCDAHCNHGAYYKFHVSYYYHHDQSYERRSYRRSNAARIVVKMPSIRLGMF
jgi:hypothetical protein